MTTTKPERPLLASVICGYEILAIVASLLLWWFLHAINSAHPGRVYPPTPAWQNIASIATYLLALAAAITLWKMHRSAFVFLAGRFVIGLVLFIAYVSRTSPASPPTHKTLITHATARHITEGISVFFLLISACIAASAYMLLFHPRQPSTSPAPQPISKWPLPPSFSR